jgi:ATP-dependent helicase/nuclease subunit A
VSAPHGRPRDHEARVTAATNFERNLVVSAGAGTGKTTLLVERMLTAIGSGAAPLSAIAAITFTDKAAGELRHRLASGLGELAELARGGMAGSQASSANNAYAWLIENSSADPAVIAALAEDAEAKLDRATVTTIHGFCAEILRGHPLEAGLPPGFAADSGLAGRRMAAEEWTPFLEEELGPAGSREALWGRVLRTFSLAKLEELARVLAGGTTSTTMLRGTFPTVDARAVLGPGAASLAAEIRAAVDRTAGLTDAPREWLDDAFRALRLFDESGAAAARTWIEASSRLDGRMPKIGTKVAASDAEVLKTLEQRALPFVRGLRVLDEITEADLLEVLLPFARRLRARQTRVGLVDFDGLLVRARDLLRDVPYVRAAFKRRYRMILVDEFQDTDPIQYDIVFFLAEREGDSASDAYNTRLTPGKLFIVGDAKQSIYRFRGADYSAYRRAVDHVLADKGVELSLTSNFRSTSAVIEPINGLFKEPASPLWRSGRYQTRYEPITAERGDDGAPAVEVWTTGVGASASAGERRRAEGLALAAELSRMAGSGKTWKYGDVLVLFRGFSELAPYLRALREAGVPFVVSGGRNFHERTEIVQAIAVLRAVADPDDQVALLAYRRSPAGGVPDTELAEGAAGGNGSLPATAAADRRLAKLREEAWHLPVDAAVRHVLEASGLFVLSGLAFEAAQRVANLEKLVLAASEFARDGHATLIETVDALEDGFVSDEEGDSPLADAEQDAVRVMTIHRAKGLEARVVILADTAAEPSNRAPRRFKARLVRVASGEFVALDGPQFKNAAVIAASLDDTHHEEAEHVRLLYVALTRARDRLFVFAGGKGNGAWTKALSAWSIGVTHRLLDDVPPRARPPAAPPQGAPEAVARYEAAAASVLALASPPFRSPSDSGDGEAQASAIHGALRPDIAREVGAIVHAKLAGVTPLDRGEADDEAARVLSAFESSPLGARLATLEILGREVPMLLDEQQARWSGAIDLLYRDADGAIVVADYKTDTTDDGAIARHREQLDVYVRAVRRAMPGERVRAELWMLRSCRVITLEV